jgi:hypothetical protein
MKNKQLINRLVKLFDLASFFKNKLIWILIIELFIFLIFITIYYLEDNSMDEDEKIERLKFAAHGGWGTEIYKKRSFIYEFDKFFSFSFSSIELNKYFLLKT